MYSAVLQRRLVGILLATCASLAAAQDRGPSPIEHASAYVFADDPDGCVLIGIQATQLNNVSRERLLSVTVFKDDSRTDCSASPDFRLVAHGQTKQFDLRFSPRLANAVATANLPMTTSNGGLATYSVTVTWQAVGNRVYARQAMAIDGSATPLEHRHGYARPATIQASVINSGRDFAAQLSRSEGFLSSGATLLAAP